MAVQFLLKPTLIIFFFIIPALSFREVGAKNKGSGRETYLDIIEKAQLLSLQKDRQQALLILESALKQEGPKSKAGSELKKQISQLARIFISDRTQSLFELGLAYLPKDVPAASQKLTEALRIEPDNLQLLLAQIRLLLLKADCVGAQGLFLKQNLKRYLLFDGEVELAQAQISFCNKSSVELKAFFANSEYRKSPLLKFWNSLEIRRCIDERNFARAKDLIDETIRLDPQYPEVYYLQWKLGVQSDTPNPDSAQKYLMRCKNLTPQQFRELILDPLTCVAQAEVERVDAAK